MEFLVPLSIFGKVGAWIMGGIGALIVMIIGWLGKSYLLPFLNSQIKKNLAQWILLIADDVTDYFRVKYPDSKPVEWIDQAIDKIMEVCGISKEVANRAITAAIARKGNP
jgi:hypothetical protein